MQFVWILSKNKTKVMSITHRIILLSFDEYLFTCYHGKSTKKIIQTLNLFIDNCLCFVLFVRHRIKLVIKRHIPLSFQNNIKKLFSKTTVTCTFHSIIILLSILMIVVIILSLYHHQIYQTSI